MKVHPCAIFMKELMPTAYNSMYELCKHNPMRCVIINQVSKERTYIDGHFVDIEYRNDTLEINYICVDLVAGMCGIPTMDGHCYVMYNGKSYQDMMQLYKDFKNNELSKEIDEALG